MNNPQPPAPADDTDPAEIVLRLRVQPVPGWPWTARLRQLLRTLGRTYRLRNETVIEHFKGEQPAGPEAAKEPAP